MSLRRKLFASLEELPVEGTVAGDEQITESVVAIDDVSRQTMEVNDAAEELDAAEFEQEELGEVAEALESLIADATGSLESGGLDATAAHFAYKAANFALGRIGHQIQVPSAESFGGSASRLKQTTVSVEGWKETLKSIWDAILNTIKKIAEFFKKFWNNKLSEAARLKTRADAMFARADKEAPKDGSIDVAAAKFHIGGKLPTKGDDLRDSITDVVEMTKLAVGQRAKDNNAYLDELAAKVNAIDVSSDIKFGETLAPVIEVAKKGVPAFEGWKDSDDSSYAKLKEEGLSVTESAELPGGKRIRLVRVGGGLSSAQPKALFTAFGKQTISVDSVGEAPKENGKMAPLTKDQIKAFAKSLSDAMSAIINAKNAFKDASDLADKIEAVGKKFAGSAAKADSLNEANKAIMSSGLGTLVKSVGNLSSKGIKEISSYATAYTTIVLDLCDKSFKAKAADEKKADEPAKAAEPAAAGA